MNVEKNRLSSFCMWPIDAPVSPVAIAKAGFYAVEKPLTVKCFACELTISCWDNNGNIAIEHELFNPSCPFILDPLTSGNVSATGEVQPAVKTSTAVLDPPAFSNALASSQIQPVTTSAFVLNTASVSDVPVSTQPCGTSDAMPVTSQPAVFNAQPQPSASDAMPVTSQLVVSSAQPQPSASDAMLVTSQPAVSSDDDDKLASVVGRLETFENWPKPNIVSPQKLAEAGLFYLKVENKTKCFYCRGIITQWEVGYDPNLEHACIFPDCPFVTSFILPKLTLGKDSRNHNTAQLRFEHLNIVGNENLDDLGVFEHKSPRRPMYSTVASRLGSFTFWSSNKMHICEMLAQAGFFYRDFDDCIVCFHCYGFLNNWDDEGDPWVEHARCFPSCYFVKLAKGQDFIKSCIVMHAKEETAVRTHQPDLGERIVSAALKRLNRLREQQSGPGTSGKYNSKATSKRHHNVTKAKVKPLKEPYSFSKDAMLCKVCMDSRVRIVFLPCGHLATCANCASSLKECPICRSTIKLTLRVSLL